MKKIFLIIAAAGLFSAGLNAQTLKFDFGSSKAEDGYTPVVCTQTYSDEVGFGFEPGATLTDIVNKKGSALTRDFVTSSGGPFRFSVRLPEGSYRVKLILGDTAGTSCTTVKSEVRRLHVADLRTAEGEVTEAVFNVNVRLQPFRKATR